MDRMTGRLVGRFQQVVVDDLVDHLKSGELQYSPETISRIDVAGPDGKPLDPAPMVSPRDGFRSRGIKEG